MSIDRLRAKRYLEIGVDEGTCFSAIEAPEKLGVDPIPAQPIVADEIKKAGVHYFSMTSDAFFEKEAPTALTGGVDVVFIDGLHTYEQAYIDCVNSLKYLNRGGVILLHDCLPRSEAEARIADDYADAKRLNAKVVGWDGSWVGDVWKAIVRLRAQHPELETLVLNCDHGVGVVIKGQNRSGLTLTVDQINKLTFADLMSNLNSYLGLKKPQILKRRLPR